MQKQIGDIMVYNWFNFCFQWFEGSQLHMATMYRFQEEDFITFETIKTLKEQGCVPKNAVLSGVSSLGRMTKEQFDPTGEVIERAQYDE